MNVLKAVAQAIGCFVLGVDHFGKNLEAGTRGASSKEAAGDLVLACLGDKELSGNVTNTRLAVRKNRGGQQGQEYPVHAADGGGAGAGRGWRADHHHGGGLAAGAARRGAAGAGSLGASRRQDQRTAVLRLKRVLMAVLAEHGVELPIPPDGPVVRMIDQEIVREQFYAHTPADGTPEQKGQFRRQQFNAGARLGREISS